MLEYRLFHIFAGVNASEMKRSILFCLLLMLLLPVAAQQQVPLRLLTWNLENLFDTEDDEGFADEEFLPEGTLDKAPLLGEDDGGGPCRSSCG